MKRLLTIILVIAAMISTMACTSSWEAPEGAFSENDMGIRIADKTYAIRTDSAPLIEALGDEYEYSYVVSCVYEGDDKTYEYSNIIVSTVPVDGKDIIEMVTITGQGHTTLRGIGVGATLEDIVAAYGEDYFDDGYITYTYENDPQDYNAERIQFEFGDDDRVKTIYIYSPSY